MTVELISVGTEILLGNIVNTNAAYLSEKCALLGLSCFHQSVVGDNEERMEEAIRLAVSRSDIVILGAQAVRKSYPHFFDDFACLGGAVTLEQDA